MNESIFITTTDQKLYGWGWNEHGNFGTGDTQDLADITLISSDVQVLIGNGAYSIIKY